MRKNRHPFVTRPDNGRTLLWELWESKMGVTISKKSLAGNKVRLILDINQHGYRERITLENLYLYKRPKNEQERLHNQQAKEQANHIRSKRELELNAQDYNITPVFKKKVNLMPVFDQYVANYQKKNKNSTKACLTHFKDFIGKPSLLNTGLTEQVCIQYREYLDRHLQGETPYDYFMHFKRMVKYTFRAGLLKTDPTANIRNHKQEGDLKNILTIEEISTLAKTPCNSPEVKRAFLFACYSGLRACDVRQLRWEHIKGDNLNITQSKTNIPIHAALHPTALKLIGKRQAPEAHIFRLPSQNAINKTLKAWAQRAKLDKHVTFHCARHSFATNLLLYDADIYNVSRLMGHTSLKHTERYLRIVESMQKNVLNKLPNL